MHQPLRADHTFGAFLVIEYLQRATNRPETQTQPPGVPSAHFTVRWDKHADGILGPFFNPGVENARVAQPSRPIRFHHWSPLEWSQISFLPITPTADFMTMQVRPNLKRARPSTCEFVFALALHSVFQGHKDIQVLRILHGAQPWPQTESQ